MGTMSPSHKRAGEPVKRVPIFRPGRHTSANGVTLDFTEDQLAASIAAYDPKKHEAPLVIGHPKDNGPAWGWVSGLSFAEGEVVADTAQVAEEFGEMVEAGRFKKVSASWYTPDSPSNPVPGVYYLRHVGFLGAMPPAIKGLSPLQFSEDEEGVVEFSDDGYATGAIARILRRMRDAWLAKFGQEEADNTLPAYLIEDLEEDARRRREAATNPEPVYNEEPSMTPEQIAQMQADLAAAQARVAALESDTTSFAEREAALAARERANAVAGITADLQQHVKAGRLLPANVAPLAEFMAGLPAEGDAVEFGEPVDGVTPKVSQRAFMAAFVASLPKAVEFNELAPGTGPNAGQLSAQDLADKAQAHIAKVKQETGRDVSYVEAVNHVVATEGGE